MFEFYKYEPFTELGRDDFANIVCKLLVDKNNGNLDNAINEIEPIYDNFFGHVRNIYELVNKHIPLFALHELMKHEKDDWGFTEEEYLEAISRTREACIEYYINN
jgi:hypothetical protein